MEINKRLMEINKRLMEINKRLMEIKKRLMEIKKRLIRTMLCTMALAATAQAQIHKTIVLRDGWTFSKDGGTFNAVTLPHDWAISGKFDKNNDVWRSESFVDGKKVINESTGIPVRCRGRE